MQEAFMALTRRDCATAGGIAVAAQMLGAFGAGGLADSSHSGRNQEVLHVTSSKVPGVELTQSFPLLDKLSLS